MESLKSQIISNLAKLQEESKHINSNLKKLVEQNLSVVRYIEDLTLKELSNNKNHCFNVTSQQHTTIQKLLFINIDLEELLLTCQSADNKEIKKTKTVKELDSVTESSNNEKDSSGYGNQADGSDFTDTGELKAAVTKKLKHLNLLSRSSKTHPHSQTMSSLSSLLEEMEKIGITKEIVDSFSESSNNGNDTSGSGRTSNGSDFSESVELKEGATEKLKRSNLRSRKERDNQNVRKLSLSDLSLPDMEQDTLKRRKERKCRHSENVTETPVDPKVTEATLDAKVLEPSVDTNVPESRDKKVEEVKNLKVLADSPEPFVGMRCIVSHMISPSEFYINSWDENIHKLENISQEVAEIYGQSYTPYKTKQEAKDNLGKYCLCYLDKWNYWYRAQVINWHMKAWGYRENVVTVFILDFGYVTTTSYVNLRELLDQHCSIPKYAIKCHLKLFPLGLINSPEEWPVKTIDVMKEFVGAENENVFQIVDVKRERDSYAVDLVGEKAEESTTLAQYLVDKGVATRTISTTKTADGNGPLKYVVDQTTPTNSNSSDAEVIRALSGNVQEKKELQTYFETRQCLFFQRNGYCVLRSCRYRHNLTETRNY